MAEKTYLEEVGRPHSQTSLGHARAWEIRHLLNDSTLPPLIYVVESETGQRFLLGREICGRPKFNLIRYIAKYFVELFFERFKGRNLHQYLILRGAYPFDLQCPIGVVPPFDISLLPTGFIKLQRILNRDGTDWEIQGQGLIGEYRGDTWLIPDTAIASGTTIAFFLRNAFSRHRPKQIYLFSACGSREGIQRIFQECKTVGVELIPILSQCLFEVSREGNLPGRPLTDLPVLNSGSITTKDFYAKAFHRYQGTRMCSIGDIGESLEDPLQHSLRTLWEMQALGMDPQQENWEAWTLDVGTEDFQRKVSEFNPALLDYFQKAWNERR